MFYFTCQNRRSLNTGVVIVEVFLLIVRRSGAWFTGSTPQRWNEMRSARSDGSRQSERSERKWAPFPFLFRSLSVCIFARKQFFFAIIPLNVSFPLLVHVSRRRRTAPSSGLDTLLRRRWLEIWRQAKGRGRQLPEKKQNCKHSGRQITPPPTTTTTLHPSIPPSNPVSITHTHKDLQSITHWCSVALSPTIKEQMHMHRLLSWILIIYKVNWMCFLASWIFSSPHIKNETLLHFLFSPSVILSLYFLSLSRSLSK